MRFRACTHTLGARLLLMGLTVAFSNTQAMATARVEQNVVYGMYSGLALTMGVYYPEESNRRGILLIPGSGWHNPGEGYADPELKAGYEYINSVRDALVARGFTVFVANHRSAPVFTYPAAVEDAQRAVRFVRHHASRFGVDPDLLGALGHSSGAHLVAMLGVEDGFGREHDDDAVETNSSKVQAVVAIAAPFDLAAVSTQYGLATVVAFMGERPPRDENGVFLRKGRYGEASPVTHVTPDDAPFLIIQGKDDTVVPADQLDIMMRALRQANVNAEPILIEDGSHSPPLDLELISTWLEGRLLD